MSRASLVAAGAALLGVAACDTTSVAPPYGVPPGRPPNAGVDGASAGDAKAAAVGDAASTSDAIDASDGGTGS